MIKWPRHTTCCIGFKNIRYILNTPVAAKMDQDQRKWNAAYTDSQNVLMMGNKYNSSEIP